MTRRDLGVEGQFELAEMTRFAPAPQEGADAARLHLRAIVVKIHECHPSSRRRAGSITCEVIPRCSGCGGLNQAPFT